jgi:hypothetical protein
VQTIGSHLKEIKMRRGGGFRILAALLLLGFIGVLTAGAYGAGFAAGTASGSTNVPAWAYGGAFGAGHVIGLLVTIVVLILIVRLIGLAFFGGHRRAWAHRGDWRTWDDSGAVEPGSRPGGLAQERVAGGRAGCVRRVPSPGPHDRTARDWHRPGEPDGPVSPGKARPRRR